MEDGVVADMVVEDSMDLPRVFYTVYGLATRTGNLPTDSRRCQKACVK